LVWLIVLGIIVAIIVLIMLIPVGADISYENGELGVSAKVCGILIQLLPKKPADESEPKKEKKPPKEKKPKKEKTEKSDKPKKKLSFNKEEIFALVKAVIRGFGKFGKLTVDRFKLHYVAGGTDPYDTAMTYNYVNAALSTLAPICEEKFIVKDCDIWTNVDFTEDKTKIDFGLCVVIRIGQVFRTVFAIGFAALGILIKNKIRLRKEKKLNPEQESEPAVKLEAGDVVIEVNNDTIKDKEEIKEKTQEEERTDSNGQ
jgi:hypothetical protein